MRRKRLWLPERNSGVPLGRFPNPMTPGQWVDGELARWSDSGTVDGALFSKELPNCFAVTKQALSFSPFLPKIRSCFLFPLHALSSSSGAGPAEAYQARPTGPGALPSQPPLSFLSAVERGLLFYGHTHGIWKFPSQGFKLSCSCNLHHSCSD